MLNEFSLAPVSENTLMIYHHHPKLDEASAQIRLLYQQISLQLSAYITEQVPAYRSLLVSFKQLSHQELIIKIQQLISQLPIKIKANTSIKCHKIPVCYHPDLALDLTTLAATKGLSVGQIIELHSQKKYQVYAIGFAPGFSYLGEVDERIAMPRHATPRKSVPSGSVGIADQQTAIYPSQSPGGWQIIGRSPQVLFDPQKSPASLLAPGDTVYFMPISLTEYKQYSQSRPL